MTDYNKNLQSFIHDQLNAEQQKAVTPKDGSFLVIAGAGSGKTRVITTRILNLILQHNTEPSSIIALTFTNKAAQEMQHRIQQFLPHSYNRPTIATFHSYCLRLLKTYKHLLGLPTFSIIDAQDTQKLIQNILKDHGVSNIFNAKNLLSYFSTYKMQDLLKIDSDLPLSIHHMEQFMQLYNEYEKQKRVSNYLDFDDLLYKTYALFEKNEHFKLQHQKQFRHILVDEYQDTNIIQHALLKQITLQNHNFAVDSLCAVGDEDQSIYSWRGASVQNILNFKKEFQNTHVIKLEQNYRSNQQILSIANHVISHNTQRNHKRLWSDKTSSHTPMSLECLSDLQEAYNITNLIKTLSRKESLNSIAILYRTHYQSRIIEEAFIKESIPYKMIGGIGFYERKEIKDLIAYLKLIINPFDKISFIRVINCPLRALGQKFEEIFLDAWNKQPFLNFIDIAKQLIDQKSLAPKQNGSLQHFINIFQHLSPELSPLKALENIVQQTQYINYLQDNFEKQEAQTKKENVAEFLRAAHYAEQSSKATVSTFIDDISLMQELMHQDNPNKDCVFMMTLHSAKGLEFPNVIVSGVEDGILPSNQSIEMGDIEEERRLFYVGITRAQDRIFLTHSKYRNTFGQMSVQRASRFLDEIPNHLLNKQPAAHWSKSQFSTFFEQWITGLNTAKNISYSTLTNTQKNNTNTHVIKNSNEQPGLKKLQTVKHPTFGIGIAHTIEKKGDKTFITVLFTNYGKKKIESSFLEII